MAPRWGGLRLEPYDPDARDADNDGIVQEGTAWERPAGTRLLTDLGDLARGRTSTSRPAGLRVVDRAGNDVPYTPTYGAGPSSSQKPGASTPLADHGAGTLAERGLRNVRALTQPEPPPTPEPAPTVPEPAERSYVRVPAPTDPDEIDRTIKRFVAEGHKHQPKAGSPDKRLDMLLAEQGFDGLPGVVASPDDLPEGQTVFYRGVESKEQAQDFTTGDYFVGVGNFGNGVYASNQPQTGADRWQGGGVITFALRPNAQVISYDDARALTDKLRESDPGDGSWNFPEDSIQNFAYSTSLVAALFGYDAIIVDRKEEQGFDVIEEGENYLVLLNRTAAVAVDPEAAAQLASATKTGFTQIQTKAPRGARKLEPYDPDAQDGDNDGIVQDGTPWERPAATRIVDAAGRELRRGLNTQTRPAGTRIVDTDGNTVKYTPKDDPEVERPTIGGDAPRPSIGNVEPAEPSTPGLLERPAEGSTPLADHGAANLKERGLRTVRDMAKPPEPAKPVDKPGVEKPDIEPNVTSDVKPEVEERPEWLQVTDAAADPVTQEIIESYLELEDGWLDDEIQQQNLDELERTFGSTARQVVEAWFVGADDITYSLREDIEAGRLGSWSQQILDLVAQSPKNRTALFRGMRLQPEDRARLTQPGATLDLPVGAFSRSVTSAAEYATDPGNSTANSIIVKLEPGADRAFPLEKFSIIDESEYLVSGRYEVTGVEEIQVGEGPFPRTFTQVTVRRSTPDRPEAPPEPAAPQPATTPKPAEAALTQVPKVATEPLDSIFDLDELEESALNPLAENTDAEDVLRMLDPGNQGEDPSYDVFFALTDRVMAGLAGVEPGQPLLRVEIDDQVYWVGANWADAEPYGEREGRVRAFAATRLGDHLLAEGVEIPEFDSKYRIAITEAGRLRQVLAEDVDEINGLVVVPAEHPDHERLRHILYARDVLDQWASSSEKGESLQLMGAAEQIFGVPAPAGSAKPPEERHLAITRFVYAETQKAFADLGITHVPLHRGMGFYLGEPKSEWVQRLRDEVVDGINERIAQNTSRETKLRELIRTEVDLENEEMMRNLAYNADLRSKAQEIINDAVNETLNDVGFDDGAEVELRPISSWSLSRIEADNFGGHQYPSRTTVSATVPVERIFSMPATGPSMHDEMEMLLVGGTAGVRADAQIASRDAFDAWWTAFVLDLQNGYVD